MPAAAGSVERLQRADGSRCSPGAVLAEPRRRRLDASDPPPPPSLADAPPRATSDAPRRVPPHHDALLQAPARTSELAPPDTLAPRAAPTRLRLRA
jgi:hypothetical protein